MTINTRINYNRNVILFGKLAIATLYNSELDARRGFKFIEKRINSRLWKTIMLYCY